MFMSRAVMLSLAMILIGFTASAQDNRKGQFEIGDTLKLVFYERLADTEMNKWGKSSASGFQQRPELSGEFTILDDGKISLPLLGAFPVEGQSAIQLQDALAQAYEKVMGRPGFVTITSLERPPIYVLGPVKNPGSYKYVPGMTVFHAISLAGGFEKKALEPWQQVETVQTSAKRLDAYESLSELYTRVAVLKSERDHVAPQAPSRLVELVGSGRANQLILTEVDRRRVIVAARDKRAALLHQQVETAKKDVDLLGTRLEQDHLIQMKKDRVTALKTLLDKGTINRTFLEQAQGELADVESRRKDSSNQSLMMRQRVDELSQEEAKLDLDTRGDLENAIITLEQQINSTEREAMTNEGILGTLKAIPVGFAAGSVESQFEIVRQTPTGPIAITSSGMSVLQPGDLVRIIATDPQPATPHSAPSAVPVNTPAMPPMNILPVNTPKGQPNDTPKSSGAKDESKTGEAAHTNMVVTDKEGLFRDFMKWQKTAKAN